MLSHHRLEKSLEEKTHKHAIIILPNLMLHLTQLLALLHADQPTNGLILLRYPISTVNF